MRDKIVVGELKAGYKLNELDISMGLGISRSPLREALRVLEKDNMVVNVPRKGTYVTELSARDFVQVSQAREMIECYCIDLLKASNIRNLPRVEASLQKALALSWPIISDDQEQTIQQIKIMLEFHTRLVESAGNSMLSRMYNSISYALARYQYIYFHVNDAAKHSLDDQKKVLEFISDGEFDRAKEELKKHIDYTVVLVKNRVIYPVF